MALIPLAWAVEVPPRNGKKFRPVICSSLSTAEEERDELHRLAVADDKDFNRMFGKPEPPKIIPLYPASEVLEQ